MFGAQFYTYRFNQSNNEMQQVLKIEMFYPIQEETKQGEVRSKATFMSQPKTDTSGRYLHLPSLAYDTVAHQQCSLVQPLQQTQAQRRAKHRDAGVDSKAPGLCQTHRHIWLTFGYHPNACQVLSHILSHLCLMKTCETATEKLFPHPQSHKWVDAEQGLDPGWLWVPAHGSSHVEASQPHPCRLCILLAG